MFNSKRKKQNCPFYYRASSEPRFLANVQRYFADFPYFPSLLDQRLFTLETCCGYQYDCLGKTQHQLVVYDTIIHFDALPLATTLATAHKQNRYHNKGYYSSGERPLAPNDLFSEDKPKKNPLKRKDNSSQMNNNTHERIFCHQFYIFAIVLPLSTKTRSQRQFQNIN